MKHQTKKYHSNGVNNVNNKPVSIQRLSFSLCFTFNLLQPGVAYLHPLKTSENLRFSDVFRGIEKKHRAALG